MQPSQKVLVLYTGGTIGMQAGAAGLAPAGGFESRLQAAWRSHPGPALPAWYFRELLPLLDSANMTQANWLAMRDAIVHAVEQEGCDAVLLLHGTDTLAYSAAALSFLLLGLPVPVVLTGAMLPAGAPGSDAWPNLFGAFGRLAAGLAPGVYLSFAGRLLHGARATKLNSQVLDAFAEHGRAPSAGAAAVSAPALDYRRARRPVRIAVQPLFPGLDALQLQALLDGGVEALLLECYGSGTGPSNDAELLRVLGEARARGVVLAGISQCPQGCIDFGVYAAGSALAASGVVSGAGMGREAALGKLFSLLGCGLENSEVERLFGLDLCGELAAPAQPPRG